MCEVEVMIMSNKREIVLFISLAFCLGMMVSDFTKPKSLEAEVTNIVYDTLNNKITNLSDQVNQLRARVANLEASRTSKDAEIAALTSSVKKLTSVSKDFSVNISKLQKEVKSIKKIQLLQQKILKIQQG